MSKTLEILAPAGDAESLKAAAFSGADAVYLGLKQFSARRTAGNFDEEELRWAVGFCHARDMKVYVAVNTTAHGQELEALAQSIRIVAQSGADAMIIQDLAVAALARQIAPQLPLHGSTQMSVHSLEGAKALWDMGFSRVVLARELTLDEVRHIAQNCPIEVEVFVHGALCMSVSGQCYMSAFLGGRSGNRGGCAGPCRLPFAADASGASHLSLKDLSAVDSLPALEQAGVVSAKIEGRLRGPEYVAGAVDACRRSLGGQEYDVQMLQDVFSRSGFTNGYLENRMDSTMFGVRTQADSQASKAAMPLVRELYRREMQRVPVTFTVTTEGTDCRLTVQDAQGRQIVVQAGQPVEQAQKDPSEGIRRSLEKTGGTPFLCQNVVFEGQPGYLPGAQWNEMRRSALERLLDLRQQVTPWPCQEVALPKFGQHSTSSQPTLWARFEEWEQVPQDHSLLAGIILPIFQWHKVPQSMRGKTVLELPRAMFGALESAVKTMVEQTRNEGFLGYLAQNIAHFSLAKGLPLYGGFGLNISNPVAAESYQQMGLKAMILLPELSVTEIGQIAPQCPTWVLAYGHMPLMMTRACPLKNIRDCDRCDRSGLLTDRKNKQFPVRCAAGVRQVYNPVPLYRGDRMGEIPADAGLLYFSIEEPEEIRQVLERFAKKASWPGEFTRGLYYKGVQ